MKQFVTCIVLCAYLLVAVGCESTVVEPFDNEKFLNASRSIQGKLQFDWQLVAHPVPANQDQFEKYTQLDGDWQLKGGELVAVSGDANRAIVLSESGHDPLRIELEVTMLSQPHGRIGDVTVMLNTVNGKKYFQTGYTLTTSSYWDNCTTFYRNGKAIAHTEMSPLKPGERSRIIVECRQGHLRYWVNDQIVLEAWDASPLQLTPDRFIALRTWDTQMIVHSVKIYKAK